MILHVAVHINSPLVLLAFEGLFKHELCLVAKAGCLSRQNVGKVMARNGKSAVKPNEKPKAMVRVPLALHPMPFLGMKPPHYICSCQHRSVTAHAETHSAVCTSEAPSTRYA